jgi:predicted nucleic acid-binding Zn ribbon protein
MIGISTKIKGFTLTMTTGPWRGRLGEKGERGDKVRYKEKECGREMQRENMH